MSLVTASLLMRKEKHHLGWYIILIALLASMAISFSRTYWLALGIGLLFLKYKHSWKRWLTVSAGASACLALLFIAVNASASGGKSLGLELIGLRFGSIVRPAEEVSAATRAALLQPIKQLIVASPIFGTGLGASVTYTPAQMGQSPYLSPSALNQFTSMITTTEFDWGYLEMLAELGSVGAILFLSVVGGSIALLLGRIRAVSDYHDFYVGLMAGLISFHVMTITMPALFHVFGIFFLTLVTAIALKSHSLLDDVLKILYRIFRRSYIQ